MNRPSLSIPFDAVCFHAQQGVEKYFKAILVANGLPIPRIHDLRRLWTLVRGCSGHPKGRVEGLGRLSVGAVEYRYPGRRATRATASRAVVFLQRARAYSRKLPGLP